MDKKGKGRFEARTHDGSGRDTRSLKQSPKDELASPIGEVGVTPSAISSAVANRKGSAVLDGMCNSMCRVDMQSRRRMELRTLRVCVSWRCPRRAFSSL